MAQPAELIRPDSVAPFSVAEIARRLGTSLTNASHATATGVAMSSAEVVAGDIFFALPGARVHGAEFAPNAIARGAVAIVTDSSGAATLGDVSVPLVVLDNPRAACGLVSSWVYATDTSTPRLMGITGTNGKTTVVYLVAAILNQLGRVTGLSSTSERLIAGRSFRAGLTTPEANQMHALVAAMTQAGVTEAVLEVSAHALSRHRISGVHFDVVGFTNFSQDHLDDYASMDEYFEAKMQLFTPSYASRGVIVVDSEWMREAASRASIPVTTLARSGTEADWSVDITARDESSTSFTVVAPDGTRASTSVPLVGDFSALNAALAIVMCVEAGFELTEIARVLESEGGIKVTIPGRTELISGNARLKFFVDYGHTPEAFTATLQALRAITHGRLIMVFGADGDRDTTKRGAMGANAARGADVVVVTDFHPRSEDPEAIRSQLLAGAREAATQSDIHEVADPAAAVRYAISLASEGDTILYAGPGHEDYREIAGTKIAYDARADSRNALIEAGWSVA